MNRYERMLGKAGGSVEEFCERQLLDVYPFSGLSRFFAPRGVGTGMYAICGAHY